MIEAALRKLGENSDGDESRNKAIYDDIARHYRQRLAALERALGGGRVFSQQHDLFEKLTSELRSAERAAAVQLRDQDRISDDVLRTLLRELDLLDARPGARYPEEDDDSNQ